MTNIITKSTQQVEYKFFIFPNDCFDKMKQMQFDVDCGTRIISKGLSLAIVTFSFIYKVPQIMKMKANKSAVGFTPLSILLEVIATMFTVAYFYNNGYPLMNYFEQINVLLQTLVVFQLVYVYNQMTSQQHKQYFGLIVLLMGIVFSGFLPTTIVSLLLTVSSSFYCFSRYLQIKQILALRYSGSVSIITCLLSFGGIAARTFTLLVDLKDDLFLVVIQLLTMSFSGGLLLSAIIYRNPPVVVQTKKVK